MYIRMMQEDNSHTYACFHVYMSCTCRKELNIVGTFDRFFSVYKMGLVLEG
jgi:hypothetical protein